jgi:hypothetical protein
MFCNCELGHQLFEEFQPFTMELDRKGVQSREVAVIDGSADSCAQATL